jgi:hypothetical protein
MANIKITALPGVLAAPLAGTEVLEIVQGGVSNKVTASKLAAAYSTDAANILPAANGGTGQSSYAIGDILYASTTTALSKLADVATGNAIISGGVGVAPSYGKIGLTTHVSGTLPTTNGGTNLTSFTSGGAVYATSTSALTTGTLPVASGGTGATTLTGYVKGTGTTAMTAAATIPFNDMSGRAWINASSSLDQTGSTSTATAITMNTGTTGVGITVNASTQITFTDAGTYMLSPSFQFANSAASDYTVTVWLRKNGTNIASSATISSVPKVADGGVHNASFTWNETVTAGQYIEIMFLVQNTAVTLDATVAGAVAPAIPSVICPVTRIA